MEVRDAIRHFITKEKVDGSVHLKAMNAFHDKPAARKNILILRGLLVHGILLLCLKKRWTTTADPGLSLSKSMDEEFYINHDYN